MSMKRVPIRCISLYNAMIRAKDVEYSDTLTLDRSCKQKFMMHWQCTDACCPGCPLFTGGLGHLLPQAAKTPAQQVRLQVGEPTTQKWYSPALWVASLLLLQEGQSCEELPFKLSDAAGADASFCHLRCVTAFDLYKPGFSTLKTGLGTGMLSDMSLA